MTDGFSTAPPQALAADRLRRRCSLDEAAPGPAPEPAIDPALTAQPRALEAIDLATAIDRPGYNLFVMGEYGPSTHRMVTRLLSERARTADRPSDWVYVNNFDAPDKPIAIELPPGRADPLRADMQALIDDLRASLPAVFESEDYRNRRETIEEQIQSQQEAAFNALATEARDRGAAIVRTPMGFAVAPLRDGQVVSPEVFQKWSKQDQDEAQKVISDIQEKLQELMRAAPRFEKKRRESVRKLDRETAQLVVGQAVDEVMARYQGLSAVLAYLETIRDTLIEHAALFLAAAEAESQALGGPSRADGGFDAFKVNVMVSSPEAEAGAPVITEDHPTLANLIGRVEHVSQQGALLTNFSLIKPGALHRANGGFLLLDARQILSEPFAWQALKRVLHAGAVRITSPAELMGFAATVSLEPDPIPVSVKVVIFGERLHYYLLMQLDPEMARLFKVAADFEDDTPRTPDSERDLALLLSRAAERDKLLPLKRDALEAAVEYAARHADDAGRLSLDIDRLTDRLREADHFSRKAGRAEIAREDFDAAIAAEKRRGDRIPERSREMVMRDLALIDTDGAVVGQINGLAVLQIGDTRFGRPSRITARTRMGAGKLVDIEREVALGGPLHSKGVLILSGFLASRYAQDMPMSLSASLVFEQSYGGVDGDSASSAELYALLSALSDLPIRQDLAVTGSVNQLGRVQAIGGVNDKIEGFYDLCAARGLTGKQGVMIPDSNAQQLMLREDVAQACGEGRFAVYPISTIDQGIALLTGCEAGERDADGRYPADSVNGRVEATLRRYARSRREFGAKDGNGAEDKPADQPKPTPPQEPPQDPPKEPPKEGETA